MWVYSGPWKLKVWWEVFDHYPFCVTSPKEEGWIILEKYELLSHSQVVEGKEIINFE